MDWIDRLLPPRCLLCDDPGIDGLALCPGCLADLPRNDRACARCAEPLPATPADVPDLTVCGRCLWRPPPYVAIHVPFCYAPPLDWLVRRFKFHGDLAAGRLLGQLLARCISAPPPAPAAVVPVPLHRRRLHARGYNQAAELARPLARSAGLSLRPTALARSIATPAQMDLPAAARRDNVRGAFRLARPPREPAIILVDDVVTTASTVREAARVLAACGWRWIEVRALARA